MGGKADQVTGRVKEAAGALVGDEKLRRYEKSYGHFRRVFTLPTSLESEKIEARYENGVLELYLPKAEAAKPRQVTVEAGKSGFFEKFLGAKKQESKGGVA